MTKMMPGRVMDTRVLPVEDVKRVITPRVETTSELRPRLLSAIESLPHNAVGVRSKDSALYLRIGKRIIDVTLVLLSAPLVLPVVLLTALALWIESGLPFYQQKRMRADGTMYDILKLRTMVRDADAIFDDLLAADPALKAEWDETQKLKDDPRITPVGRFLRKTSLDELPQLWNVLAGDMSLIGPRPVLPGQVAIYDGPLYWGMRPGISGLWQVSERNDRNFDYRAEMDRVYRREVSFRADLMILVRTVGVMLRRTGY